VPNLAPAPGAKTKLTKSASVRYENDGKSIASDSTRMGGNVTRSVAAGAALMPSNNLA